MAEQHPHHAHDHHLAHSTPLPPHPAFIVRSTRTRAPFWIALCIMIIATAYTFYYLQNQRVVNLQSQLTSSQRSVNSLNNQVAELQQNTSSSLLSDDTRQIPELGISLALPASLQDLTYAVVNDSATNGNTSTIVGMSTLGLVSLDPNCNAAEAPLGWLSKTSGQFSAKAPKTTSFKLVKQYASYYLAYEAPQSNCSTNKTTQTTVTADLNALPNWLTAIQLLP